MTPAEHAKVWRRAADNVVKTSRTLIAERGQKASDFLASAIIVTETVAQAYEEAAKEQEGRDKQS